jgi:hypothetical protein
MLLIVQFVLASLLIVSASAIVLTWLLLVALSYSGQIMPWVAAGVVIYGHIFIGLAALVGVPGIFWVRNLAVRVDLKWRRIARTLGLVGTIFLVLGFFVAIAVLVSEQMRPKNPHDGCVSYRDPTATAAMEARGEKPQNDCPKSK